MAKRKNTPPKTGAVWHLSAEEATLARKPRYNAHICKTGAHGDAKYNRHKAKRDWEKQLRNEGTLRGPLLFQLAAMSCRSRRRSGAPSFGPLVGEGQSGERRGRGGPEGAALGL